MTMKNSEIGLIPEEWKATRIGELFDIGAGGDLDKSNFSPVRDESHGFPIYANGLSDKGLYGFSSYSSRDAGSITVTARGTLGAANFRNQPFVAIGRLLVLKPKEKDHDGRFFAEYLNAKVRFASESTGVPQLTAPQVSQYWVAEPPSHEQAAIANVLDDIDCYLNQLDQLITKKRDIKKGAMQELLTGKRRLPGFSGEWAEKTLGEIAHIKTGSRNNQDKVESGAYPFFVRSANVERINSYSYDCEAILIPGEGGIGSIFHYINGRFDVHQRVYAITQFDEMVFGKFIFYFMAEHFGIHAMQNSVKATVDSLRLPTFTNFLLRLPPSREEQDAIAEILSDLEDEIAVLEAQREKTAALKQGMMQQLLTGKIRLT